MPTVRFTYHTVTSESAEQGDFADHGFYDPDGGWKYSIAGGIEELESNVYRYEEGLASALQKARNLGIYQYSDGREVAFNYRWWSSVDPDQDYSTGEDTYYSLHIEGVTLSTRKRIHRWLNGKRVIPIKKRSILDVKA